MNNKDVPEKILEAYDDVFADIVNVLLFHGEQQMAPEELEEQAPRAAYKADGKIREMERDVVKRWTRENVKIACIGLENQTDSDPLMPIRVIGYDGTEYRGQLRKNQKNISPVITMVLYFGYEKHWDKPLQLKACLSIPAYLEPYVNDYQVHLFEIAYLSDEQVEMFKSDFRIVADYFVQMRKNNDYVPSSIEMKHVQEVLQLLNVLTKDYRFESAYHESKEVPKTMSEYLDRIINEAEENVAKLLTVLFSENRMDDAKRVVVDADYRHQLMKELLSIEG